MILAGFLLGLQFNPEIQLLRSKQTWCMLLAGFLLGLQFNPEVQPS
jgi:hypothetical protein